jgi:putative Mg2+ transporter-C (MgtC) family protein
VIDLSNTDAAIRVVVALLVGAFIGIEREWRNKPAGLRTYALVCEGSALFMIGAILLYDDVHAAGGTTADPSRIGSTVVQGIGFLAGGVIFTAGAKVHGLTTAAGIWVTAALGILIGAGFYEVALVGAGLTIITLSLFRVVERYIPSATTFEQGGEEPSGGDRRPRSRDRS